MTYERSPRPLALDLVQCFNVNEPVENARTSRLGENFWGASLPWWAVVAYGCASQGVAKVVTIANAKNHFGGQNLYEGRIM